MKTDLFQSCGHCWVFQICWHIECSTFTASSFRIWNSSTGIPWPPLALFVVMLPKAHLTSHSRMSGCRWVITPLWLSGSWRSLEYLLSHKKEWNFAICSSMDGGHDAKWNKSDRGRQILCDITYRWNLKEYNKLVNITKEKQTHRYREQTSDGQRGEGNGEEYTVSWGGLMLLRVKEALLILSGAHHQVLICIFDFICILTSHVVVSPPSVVLNGCSYWAVCVWAQRPRQTETGGGDRRGSLLLAFSGSQVRVRIWRTCENPEAVPTPRVFDSVVGSWDA